MTWIATGVTVAATLYSAHSANEAAKAGAAQSRVAAAAATSEAALNSATADQEAIDIKKSAHGQADQIKRAAMLRRGEILVAQSASGAVIGEGSAQAAFDQVDALSSADALVALYSGVNAAAAKRQQGRLGLMAGANKATAYGMEAASQEAAGQRALVGGVLNAGAQGANGYAKSKK